MALAVESHGLLRGGEALLDFGVPGVAAGDCVAPLPDLFGEGPQLLP